MQILVVSSQTADNTSITEASLVSSYENERVIFFMQSWGISTLAVTHCKLTAVYYDKVVDI